MRLTFLPLIGAAVFLLVVVLSGALLLAACGVRLPLGLGVWGQCPSSASSEDLERLHDERLRLESEIAGLELELSGLDCAMAEEDGREAPPAVALSPELLEEGNVSALAGCWSLTSRFQVVEENTGVVSAWRSRGAE